MPQMGYDMQEGTVVRWLKDEGAEVKMGEPIAEIETDKAVVEFESYASGVLSRIVVGEGSTVPVGQTIAVVGEPGEEIPETPAAQSPTPETSETPSEAPASAESTQESSEAPAPAESTQESKVAAPVAEAPVTASAVPAASEGDRKSLRASPVARRIADEKGVSLSQINGTGPGGRIVKDDVLAFVESGAPAEPAAPTAEKQAPQPVAAAPEGDAEAAGAGEKVALSRMRQQIARVTVRSKTEKPHFYVSADIDMTEAMALRQQINGALESEGVRVTVNDLIIKACVESLKVYPKFNAYYAEDAIQMNENINIGVAIAVEEGLLMPAIMQCNNKTLKQIAVASRDLSNRAQTGSLRNQEYSGGTFSISNLGMFDVTSFVAIIQPPQSAILAVGTVTKKPVVVDDQVTVRQIMTATLAADHRVVDGAEGARFLIEVKRLLENPMSAIV